MSPEQVQEELGPEPQLADESRFVGAEAKQTNSAREGLIAFKFGGSSLLGAQRMLHAASLVRPVAETSRVVVIVSAMKGVPDRLLATAHALADRKPQTARAEAEGLLRLH